VGATRGEEWTTGTAKSVRERRIQRYQRKQQQAEHDFQEQHVWNEDIEVFSGKKIQIRRTPPTYPDSPSTGAPLESLEVKADMVELERCISELTMRSSQAYPTANSSLDNRRMAFYAVGQKSRQCGRGGNRRCFFSGKLILGGAPFYAGCLEQGMRTLVVFCLPSALGLPKRDGNGDGHVIGRTGQSLLSGILRSRENNSDSYESFGLLNKRAQQRHRSIPSRYLSGVSTTSKSNASKSRLSSLDDFTSSIDGDLDPNWNIDSEYLLQVLPQPGRDLLEQMQSLYPDQLATLSLPIRDHGVWKLYVLFCFFSGLPIAQDELYYKVRDDVADQVWGEHIVLSHHVMEAIHGDSLDLILLPNQQTFRYLQRNYSQQYSKLDESVFQRKCWERIPPSL
jgi:hypothetical protein